MKKTLLYWSFAATPLRRKDYLIATLVWMAVEFGVNTVVDPPDEITLGMFLLFLGFVVFYWLFATLCSRRLDSAGFGFLGPFRPFVLFVGYIALFMLASGIFEEYFILVDAAIIAALSLLPEKPVSGTGRLRDEATGRYVEPPEEASA